jgi:hypothetical protein
MLIASAMAWLSVVGTFGAIVVALGLGLGLGDWFLRPKLVLHSDRANPSDRVITPDPQGREVGFLRLHVANNGRTTARNVLVTVTSVSQWLEETRTWQRTRAELDGRALKWGGSALATVDVPRRGQRPVDFLEITREPAQQGTIPMRIYIQGDAPASHANDLPPGGWRVRLVLSADNVSAEEYEMRVRFDGTWPPEPLDRIWDAVVAQGPDRSLTDGPPPE